MPVTFQTVDSLMGHIGGNRINLETDTFKAVLTNTAPVVGNDDLSDIIQLANGNGYLTDGVPLTSITWTGAGNVWKFSSANFEWNASGGAIGPFRYVPIYSFTSTGKLLVGWFDFGSPLTIPDGSFFRVEIGANGIVRFGVGTIGA